MEHKEQATKQKVNCTLIGKCQSRDLEIDFKTRDHCYKCIHNIARRELVQSLMEMATIKDYQ
jgi:hypothetical protein